MKKKKKSGSIAIPFLLTFLIALIIIGGIAMIIYDKIDSDNSSLLTMNNEAGSLSDSDSHTILLVLDLSDTVDDSSDSSDDDSSEEEDADSSEEETYDWEVTDEDESDSKSSSQKAYTFMIMRSMPVHKQIMFIGLPENMLAGESNRSLTEIYKSGGAAELKSAAEFSFDIPVDRYMVFDSKSFQKLCNIMGGVNFAVPGNIEGFKKTDGMQYLSPDQIEKVISYGGFSGGEVQRVSTAASLITAMTNQANGTRIADNLDNTFETFVNACDTDISALDYQQEKYAIKFLMKYSDPKDDETVSSRAKFLTPSGTQTADKFVLDISFIDEISQYFVVEATSAAEQETLQPMIPETEKAKENNDAQ